MPEFVPPGRLVQNPPPTEPAGKDGFWSRKREIRLRWREGAEEEEEGAAASDGVGVLLSCCDGASHLCRLSVLKPPKQLQPDTFRRGLPINANVCLPPPGPPAGPQTSPTLRCCARVLIKPPPAVRPLSSAPSPLLVRLESAVIYCRATSQTGRRAAGAGGGAGEACRMTEVGRGSARTGSITQRRARLCLGRSLVLFL